MNAPAPYEPRIPSDSMPPGRAALSVTWAALPFLTLGYATPFTFAAAALWRRSVHLLVSTAAYLGVFVVMLFLLPDLRKDGGAEGMVGVLLFILAVVGCAHAFLIRRRVFDPHGLSAVDNEAVVEQVKRRRLLRDKARELAETDPGLAKELRIGRPDLPRQYNDGGLVDVNHAPAEALTLLPGITPELAAKIERVRAETGGFMSAEELSAVAGLPPDLTGGLVDHAVFIR
ncbi:DNA uptake protein ComE-like DNA-binding protein [Actinomadura pelletieri DSM 43383]|uniref:DNA uptake protein ComE-like DNA-binding protein n=1 Tax=Actinomadura pelletieri DSM 43383 TaxID=1120940 RepID=A0A495QP83_9ACTN|nr:helix-hairpin-helix domain-containing protein [Actinomadura pelletieri]RKS74746.1 DNA uptake protein ComE-like DNA-binding protein [Actinomadura pelletieri DSM 43383]